MYKITDITTLGKEYAISTKDNGVIGSIRIVMLTEIHDAMLGPYTPVFSTYDNYMQKSVTLLSGFDKIDPYDILWYATSDEELELAQLIEYAIRHRYSTVVLEYLYED